MKIDVIVIGGGPAGLMASIAAAEQGAKTLLLDKGQQLGRKLLLSGGGRCNVTNRLPLDEFIQHVPGNGRFLYGAFSQFSNEDVIQFFHKLGVPLKEEDHGRMFPVSDKAQSVVNTLIKRFQSLGGHISTNSPVKKICYEHGQAVGVVTQNNQHYSAKAIVVAVGGRSVPQTGSTGDGYNWAKKAGHTITPLFPTEVPVTSDETFIQQKTLQGLSLQDVAVSVVNPKGKTVISHRMDMIFTHFGLSGPAVLRCSQFVVQTLKKFNTDTVIMTVDSKPELNAEQVFQEILQTVKNDGRKSIKNGLKGFLPERYLLFLLQMAEIGVEEPLHAIAHEKWRNFAGLVKQFPIRVNGTLPLEKAFVTGGGISVKEIIPQTMGSKLISNLFFCGEILDIHAYTGGYNITCAMVTGRIAGESAAIISACS